MGSGAAATRRHVGLLLLFPLGCTAPEGEDSCDGKQTAPIFGGSSSDRYLGLGARQENAIVALQTLDAERGTVIPCSGALIAPTWVMTARHCAVGGDATVFLGSGVDTAELAVQGTSWQLPDEPGLDVALLALDRVVPSELARPLPLSALEPEQVLGARLLLAGSGVTEDHLVGVRRFVTEAVVDVRNGVLTVDGRGDSGACIADSGSPAIWREGEPSIVGVLTEGDSSCRGVDTYLGVAAFRGWLESVVTESTDSTMPDCGDVTSEGGCFSSDALQQAVWCEDGRLAHSFCEVGERCGYSSTAGGFRCVESAGDECAAVTQLGACQGEEVVRCKAGRIEREACAACSTCNIVPASGKVACR